ncbi:MAG: MarR family winged helix-turn-helix transcriptional regulator [bacterium]
MGNDAMNRCCGVEGFDPRVFKDIVDLVDKLNKKFVRVSGGVTGGYGITPTQYFILNILWERDGIPLNEIADLQCCSRSTITGVVNTMERNGLVRRKRSDDDRRVVFLHLTEKGRKLRSKLTEMDGAFSRCCAGRLTVRELEQLRDLLSRLNDYIAI